MPFATKRAYETPSDADGYRVLVDRIWPRGVTKEALKLDEWAKTLAPSAHLRRWFNHDPARWAEFKRRYFQELDAQPCPQTPLLLRAKKQQITLVYAAKDEAHNNAVALREYLEARLASANPARE